MSRPEYELIAVRDGHPIMAPKRECVHLTGEDLPAPRELPFGARTRCRCGQWFALREQIFDPYDRYWRMVGRREQRRLEATWASTR